MHDVEGGGPARSPGNRGPDFWHVRGRGRGRERLVVGRVHDEEGSRCVCVRPEGGDVQPGYMRAELRAPDVKPLMMLSRRHRSVENVEESHWRRRRRGRLAQRRGLISQSNHRAQVVYHLKGAA